jgi:hypothetical protein
VIKQRSYNTRERYDGQMRKGVGEGNSDRDRENHLRWDKREVLAKARDHISTQEKVTVKLAPVIII